MHEDKGRGNTPECKLEKRAVALLFTGIGTFRGRSCALRLKVMPHVLQPAITYPLAWVLTRLVLAPPNLNPHAGGRTEIPAHDPEKVHDCMLSCTRGLAHARSTRRYDLAARRCRQKKASSVEILLTVSLPERTFVVGDHCALFLFPWMHMKSCWMTASARGQDPVGDSFMSNEMLTSGG